MVVHPSTVTGSCIPTTRITATTGIGITKQITAEGDYRTTNQRLANNFVIASSVTAGQF
jgi:hypothetical protein